MFRTTLTGERLDNIIPFGAHKPARLPQFLSDFADFAEWARMYRALGLQVVPSFLPGEVNGGKSWKRPVLKTWKGFEDDLVPQETFDQWYGPSGQHVTRQNMGVLTGRASGNLMVIDLDTHAGPDAALWWKRALVTHNADNEPETPVQVTGGGGLQILFRCPHGWNVPTCKTSIGVDIRGQGGFAVLPPSRHVSKQGYRWKEDRAPWEVEIDLAPQWLLDVVDDLVETYGAGGISGPTGQAGVKALGGEGVLDAFANYRDMRETVMAKHVWHCALEWHRECPIPPPRSQWDARGWEAYEDYERKVTVKEPAPGEDKRDGLEREDRGPSLYLSKWRATLRKWDTPYFQQEANKPPPVIEPPAPRASEPPKEKTPPEASPVSSIKLVSAFPIDEASLPVRDWAVPGLLLRRALSVLIAPPGSGKSLITLQLAIALAAGVTWGGWHPRKPEKVMIINSEDDVEEMERRLAAAARDMGVEQDTLVGRILLVEDPASIVIARMDARTKTVVRTPLIEELVTLIKENNIGVVVADPFAETFEGDESNNSEVKWAGILWREVARRTASSLLLVHHTKKYASEMAGIADASRGGGSLIGTARVMVTLFAMTEDEAIAMGVPVEERMDYVRVDDAKANYSRLDRARWFEKKSITLANGTAFLPGDEVGVLVPWVPPGMLDGISTAKLNEALDVIDAGTLDKGGNPNGGFYTASNTSANKERWAGAVLVAVTGMLEANAKTLVKQWLERGTLEVFEYDDPVQRKTRKGVRSVPENRPGRVEFEDEI
jgi:hypothetical protein